MHTYTHMPYTSTHQRTPRAPIMHTRTHAAFTQPLHIRALPLYAHARQRTPRTHALIPILTNVKVLSFLTNVKNRYCPRHESDDAYRRPGTQERALGGTSTRVSSARSICEIFHQDIRR
jgi:hypothetical protein